MSAGAGVAAGGPTDETARAAIVAERARNVAVVAGAGTGKTKTIIDRAIELIAPTAADAAPLPISRMALITFTRRAAGELRFRIRERLLRALEREARAGGPRADRLREALGSLDAAFVGTIHGFADRLLRLRPVEAALGPAYALVEDTAELVGETFLRLRRAAEAGTLAAELGEGVRGLDPILVDEAAETLRAAARAGLQMQRAESAFGPIASVEQMMEWMIDTRDVAVDLPAPPRACLDDMCAAATRLGQMVKNMRGTAFGHRQMRRMVAALQRLQGVEEPAEALRIVQDAYRGRALYLGRDFANDQTGWTIYRAVRPETTKPDSLAGKLESAHRWLATCLVRLSPVLVAMYERVKAEHGVVDYLDLLVKLRALLRDDPQARRFYQGLFDHVFVDEFQDTDPLQCEIVFYLCEDGAAASHWEEVRLAPGKLTIVGDPKQSIYRFRRADIAMYDRATERLRANGALEERLETNYRSRSQLIDFFNARLAALLGRSDGPTFDARSGRADYEDLRAAVAAAPDGVAVHLLPYAGAGDEGLLAADGRAVEAQMLACYVRALLHSGRRVRDPDGGAERPLRAGDVAVLAPTTTHLPLLLRRFDALGIEYTARGGSLFLGHPTVRQYLLALRALADRDDGVAETALLQPPFFAVDLADAVAAQAQRGDADQPRRRRMEEARAVVQDLRGQRHLRSPGATARDLIEKTALGRAVVTGANGAQTLAALYEVAAELERRAALAGLDFDAATELLRAWARSPVFLDAPEPDGTRAVRVMTIHAAKGLEFPVVVLWDGFHGFGERAGSQWRVERGGEAWALSLGGVTVEHPRGARLLERERRFGEQERRRMYYVAATRARDLLALPLPHTRSTALTYATAVLAEGLSGPAVQRFDTFRPSAPPPWAAAASAATAARPIVADPGLQAHIEAARRKFEAALAEAVRPEALPAAVTAAAADAAARDVGRDSEAGADDRADKFAGGRLGVDFGRVVHRAVQLALAGNDDVDACVALAAAENRTSERLDTAAADVRRALATLRELGANEAAIVESEYPLVMAAADGRMLAGYVDVLLLTPGAATVIDLKTDAPRPGTVGDAYPAYASQLRLYVQMLRSAGIAGGRELRAALLLTATGEMRRLQ